MDADGVGGHLVVKVRLKHLLSDNRQVDRINDAVTTMHKIGADALVFGKLSYLDALDREVENNGGVFDAAVAGRLTESFPMHSEQIEEWMDVVSSSLERRQGRPFGEERKLRQDGLHAAYKDFAFRGLLPADKLSCANMSVPKGSFAQQISVNYKTNVHCHFDKYVRRFVKVSLTAMAKRDAGLEDDAPLPAAASKVLKADIRAVCNDLLQSATQLSCREALQEWVIRLRPELMPPAPSSTPTPHWRFLSQKQHPERWLPYMVWINQKLEAAGAKLYSPLLQRTSFVPSHIRIDTNGLIDLLVAEADDAVLLKAGIEGMDMPPSSMPGPSAAVKYDLPGLMTKPKKGTPSVSKALFYNSLSKILAPSLLPRLQADPTFQTASFKTAIWRCLTKIGSNKHTSLEHMDLVFNNVIDTDGHSVSLHYVARSLYGKTCFNGGFKEIKASQRQQQADEKAKGAAYVTTLSESERAAILKGHEGCILSCDPGKGSLATVTDGNGGVVTYTFVQRRAESGAKDHARRLQELLRVRVGPGARSVGELLRSIGARPGPARRNATPAKSCTPSSYHHYLRTRRAVASDLSTFFQRTVFRAHRYDAWVGRRASEDRFVSRIKNTFGVKATILYGDWGRSPNLRHQPPSPGVGLRRRLCSHFKVYLVHEAYTSSFCPRCCNGVAKPRRDSDGRDVHHLLKCESRTCSCPWWNRDVLGALNILKTGRHALQTGTWSPTFTSHLTMATA
jgi:hypothetical protein